jgi:hypothetical protein
MEMIGKNVLLTRIYIRTRQIVFLKRKSVINLLSKWVTLFEAVHVLIHIFPGIVQIQYIFFISAYTSRQQIDLI